MSSSERVEAASRGEPRPASPRRAHALMFAAGMLVGAILCALSLGGIAPALRGGAMAIGLALARAPQVAPEGIAKVAGSDGAAPEAALVHASTEPHGATSALPRATPAREIASEPLGASQIAQRALGYTVFVRGGRVYGAGVLLDRKGHVLTCEHVIAGVESLVVSFSDGTAFDAVVVESDPKLDLALLRIDIDTDRAPVLEPAAVGSVQLGDDVFAVGAPRKMAFSLGRGMVSFVGRPFDGVYYLQTDLAMNGGSSGGPVLNDRGQLIALSSFVLRDSEGLAFALPIEYAYRRFAAHVQTPEALGGSARRAFDGWLSGQGGAQRTGAVQAR